MDKKSCERVEKFDTNDWVYSTKDRLEDAKEVRKTKFVRLA